jgi:hypothetical protein
LNKRPTGAKRIATLKGVNPWGLSAHLAECLTVPMTVFFDPNGNPRPLDQIPPRYHPMITQVVGSAPRLPVLEGASPASHPAAVGPKSLEIMSRTDIARMLIQLAGAGYVDETVLKPVPIAEHDDEQYSNVTRASEFLAKLSQAATVRRRRSGS